MRHFNLSVAAALLFAGRQAFAADVHAVDKGIEVDLGTAGSFIVDYPELLGSDQKPAHQIIEKKPAGKTASVKYEGGITLAVKIDDNGDITYLFSKLDARAKFFQTKSILPFNTLQGGTFQAGTGAAKPLPADKPQKPHLFQGNAPSLLLAAADGSKINLGMPRDYTYVQLTDNREWGWKAYALMAVTPLDPANPVMRITTSGSAKTETVTVQVDQFGQPTTFDFPDKVKSLDELKADVAAEKVYYDSLHPPTTDAFGGMPGSGAQFGLTKTGYFHTEQKANRWLLADPDGNAFYALGVCTDSPSDDYTYIKGREGIYEWLPKFEGEFNTAFRPKEPSAFSFHLANQIRKYGTPFEMVDYQTRMLTRLRKWGFNTVGPFSQQTDAVKQANFPYVSSLPFGPWPGLPELPGVSRTWDPFEPKNAEKIEKAFAENLPKRVDDPLLIGYYLSNEPLFEDMPRVVPRLNGSKFACKKRLVQMLQEKYATIDVFNTAWNLKAISFDGLIEPGLAISTPQAAADMGDFADLFFDTYYKLVHDTFKKYDTNHMLIGNRFQSGTINNERLVRTGAKYMDIISYNYYTYGVDTDRLKRIYGWANKPMMLTEWYYDSPKGSGLPGGGKDVNSQTERGLAYRNYVEQTAALPFVLGQTWFTLVDQSLTGRWFSKYSGENGDSGFVAVTDRPWKDMLGPAMDTNYNIYDVMLGKKPPFAWDDPRFVMSKASNKRLSINRAVGPVAMDGTAAGFPGVPAEPISGQRMVSGADANGLEASFKLCYDDDNVYVLVDITDPTPMKSETTADHIWSADGVELFIGHDKLDDPGQMLFSDHQILLAGSNEPKTYVANQTEQPTIPLVVVPKVDGKGYILEAKIPAAVLGFKPEENREIRFDLGIDDSTDGKRRDRQLMWNGTERNSGDRGGWGRALFVK